MGKCNLKKYEIMSVLLIVIAEILLFSEQMLGSIAVHSLNLILIIILIILRKRENIIQPLSLVSLLRIVNISLPIFFSFTIYWLASLYLILFIPIILIIKEQKLSSGYIGLTFKNIYLLPLSILLGIGLALFESIILLPNPLIPEPNFLNLFTLSILMIFFIGLGEELIFRSLLQQSIEDKSGPIIGLVIASLIFGFMQSGYMNYYEILFASLAGLVLGFSFQVTRSLPFIVIAHGVNNIILFGVLPFIIKFLKS